MPRRIVIIEDDITIVDLLTTAVEEAGGKVAWESFTSGATGMAWAERVEVASLPDLLILDLNLPAYNGLEILGRLRSRGLLAHLKVVVMSGSLNAKDRQAALSGGALAFLDKPYDLDGFFQHGRILKELIEGRGASSTSGS